VLTVSVGLVLLIACANVANLLLGRAAARAHEMRVRAAIGAGRGRLVRQLLAESTLLATLGGVAGLALARGGLAMLRELGATLDRSDLGRPATMIVPRLGEVSIDGTVLVYAMALTLVTAVLFGLAPALHLSRKVVGHHTVWTLQRGRGRLALVATQLALATVLLIGSALLIRSFIAMASTPLGFEPAGVLTFQVPLPPERYRDGRDTMQFAEELTARVRALPSVEAVGYVDSIPTSLAWRGLPDLRLASGPRLFDDGTRGRWVGHGFFEATGTRILEGRGFEESDDAAGRPVLVINESLARQAFGEQSPVGRRVYLIDGIWDPGPDEPETVWEIVGVAEDVHQTGIAQEPDPVVYLDNRQGVMPRNLESPGGWYFAVRTDGDPLALAPTLPSLVRQVDSGVSPSRVATLDRLVADLVVSPRFYSTVLGAFASVALILALIGIVGVVAYTVARRTREIGLRMALGSGHRAVLSLVLRDTLIISAMGIASGLLAALALSSFLEGMLYGLTPTDPTTLVAVPIAFVLIVAIAAYVPARGATRVDPMVALRCE
jgi:predicted permease